MTSSELATLWIAAVPAGHVSFLENVGSVSEQLNFNSASMHCVA